MKRRNADLIRLTTTALFLALTVILSRVPFLSTYIIIGGVNLVEIGFASIPSMISALLNGPAYGLVCSAGADLIGALMFPNGSMTFFPGFTIDAALFGLIPALVLKLVKGKRKLASMTSFFGIALSAIGLYLTLPFVEKFKLSGGENFSISTTTKIVIAICFLLIALVLLGITYFLSKKADKSFLLTDIFLVFIIRDFVIKSFLAPLWLQSLYGIPYEVSFISQLLTSLVSIPIDVTITYLLIIPISSIYKDELQLTYPLKKKVYTKVYKGKVLY